MLVIMFGASSREHHGVLSHPGARRRSRRTFYIVTGKNDLLRPVVASRGTGGGWICPARTLLYNLAQGACCVGGRTGGAMWFRSDHRGVRIFVRGEFVAPRQWLIHASVASGSGIDSAVGAASRQRTLKELWQAIVLESRLGRQLGAIDVRVVVDGDPDIAGLFTATDADRRITCGR